MGSNAARPFLHKWALLEAPREPDMSYSDLGLAMLVTVLVSTSCGLTRGSSIAAYPELRPAELGSMRNVRVCDERTWFGSVPSADDLDLAARRGVTRVFDLRTPSTRGDELRVTAEALGLEYAAPELPEVPTEVTGEQLDRVLEYVAQNTGGSQAEHRHERVLMFCEDGSRCALYFAVHRGTHDGVPIDEVLIEARRNGVHGEDAELFLREHVLEATRTLPADEPN